MAPQAVNKGNVIEQLLALGVSGRDRHDAGADLQRRRGLYDQQLEAQRGLVVEAQVERQQVAVRASRHRSPHARDRVEVGRHADRHRQPR